MGTRLWPVVAICLLGAAGRWCENVTTTLTTEVFTNNSTIFLQHTVQNETKAENSSNKPSPAASAKECNTSLDCHDAMSCNNGLCVCPAKSIKVNGTCLGILGLACSSLGQCEQHVSNSICAFTDATSGLCLCKPGYAAWNLQPSFLDTNMSLSSRQLHVIANSTCAAVLQAECERNKDFCSAVDNSVCAVDTAGAKRCICTDGLRPNSQAQRSAMAETNVTLSILEEPSTLCEDVIGNRCSFNHSDCDLFVPNSFCDSNSSKCTCNAGHTLDPLAKLCENNATIKEANDSAVANITRVIPSSVVNEYQLFITSRCFMLNYPCAVQNSLCMHSPFSLYEGICQCQPGYVQTSSTTCDPLDGPADEKPGIDMDDIRTTTQKPTEANTTATTTVTTTGKTTERTTAKTTEKTTTAESTTEASTTEPQTTEEATSQAQTTEGAETTESLTEEPLTTTSASVVIANPRNCGMPKSAASMYSGISSRFSVRHHPHSMHNMSKIVGGQAALDNEICWQAGVISFMPNLQNYEYCGGSILNENFVLTAMHCLVQNYDVSQPTAVDHIFVSVGVSSFPKPNSASDGCGSFRKVRGVTLNPNAMFVTNEDSTQFLGIANDLALIELEEPLDLDMGCVCAICLLDQRPAAGEDCIISGYGCQDAQCQTPPPHSLSWLKVPVVAKNDERCQHGDFRLNTEALVCIESTADQDACQGDSGGPMSCYDTERERFYLAGATSYGYGGTGQSCASGQLARYTDVTFFLDWIRSVIGNS